MAMNYRVFLFPGALQVNLCVTTAPEFGARDLSFSLLFEETVQLPSPPPAPPLTTAGYAVHHLNAGAYLHRARALLTSGALEVRYARPAPDARLSPMLHRRQPRMRIDQLPLARSTRIADTLVRATDATELRRAHAMLVQGLFGEFGTVPGANPELVPILREASRSAPAT